MSSTPVQRHYDAIVSQFEDISQEEKRELIEQVEGVVSKDSIAVKSGVTDFRPASRGGRLPLLVNLSALLLIGLVLLAAFRFFGLRRSELSLETTTYITTERSIIGALIQQSQEKLRSKDREILQIQREVEALDRQIEDLRRIVDSSIRMREEELKRSMEQALESERARLRSAGYTDQEVEARMAELEERMSSEFRRELERYTRESQESMREREQALMEEKQDAEERLRKAREEREDLLAEAEARDEELRAAYEAEKERLRQEDSEAERRFRALAEQREREQLVTDQIQGAYTAIIAKIEGEDFQGAGRDIARLRELLLSESIDYLPSIVKRRKTDLFMVGLLEDMVNARLAGRPAGAGPVEDQASVSEIRTELARVRRLVERGDDALRAGDLAHAESLYGQALREIEVVSRAFDGLTSAKAEAERRALSAHLKSAGELADQGLFTRAIDSYREGAVKSAAESADLVRALLDGLQDSVLRRERELASASREDADAAEQARMKGRESAFLDTLRLILYLSERRSGETAAADPEIESKLEDDPLFQSVAERLRVLIDAGGPPRELLAKGFQFLGTLTTVSTEGVIIEPLVSLPVQRGSEVWIKRRTASGAEVSVARGTVASASGERVVARIDEIDAAESPPRVLDLAYVRLADR